MKYVSGPVAVKELPEETPRYVAFEALARQDQTVYVDRDAVTVAERDSDHGITILRYNVAFLVIVSDSLFMAVTALPSAGHVEAMRRPQ